MVGIANRRVQSRQIVSVISKVCDIVSEISDSAKDQSLGIEQINRAVGDINQDTQENRQTLFEGVDTLTSMLEIMEGVIETMTIHPDKMWAALDERIGQLVSKGIDRDLLYQQALVTPSCGLATETVERADQTMAASAATMRR